MLGISQNKKSLGQFYTTRAQYILGNLLDILPIGAVVVDPFVGCFDLLHLVDTMRQNCFCCGYDIEPRGDDFPVETRDTLLDPPDYKGVWVVTNPPYLARNKCKDKTIFNLYKTNDLYKASIKSIMGCDGGILVVPLNFFCDEHEDSIRRQFLSEYKVRSINIFEEQVFDDTTYVVCSFSFIREANSHQELVPVFYPDGITDCRLVIRKESDYRIGAELYHQIAESQSRIAVSRLVQGEQPKGYISQLFLKAVDTGSSDGRICLERSERPFWGKDTDRAFATIVLSQKLTYAEEDVVIKRFNSLLEEYRLKYHSLFLTNFRNATKSYSRKRISFRLAFALISHVYGLEFGMKRHYEYD